MKNGTENKTEVSDKSTAPLSSEDLLKEIIHYVSKLVDLEKDASRAFKVQKILHNAILLRTEITLSKNKQS